MFVLNYSPRAEKFIDSIEKDLAIRIVKKCEELQSNPIPRQAKMVRGYREKLYRVRVGDYRILYVVDYAGKIVEIVRIDSRDRVY